MACRGRFLARTLLANLTFSPQTSPFISPLSRSCTGFGIRGLCSQIPPASAFGDVEGDCEGDGDGERGESRVSVEAGDEAKDGSRKVAVIWDLDNKPPKTVPPYDLHRKAGYLHVLWEWSLVFGQRKSMYTGFPALNILISDVSRRVVTRVQGNIGEN